MCFRCNVEVGSFLHCTWLCTKVRPFWGDICSTLSKITGVNVPLDAELCLLGNFTSFSGSFSGAQFKFMEVVLSVARKCIAVSWKSDSPLPIDRWFFVDKQLCPPSKKHLFENMATIFRPHEYVCHAKYLM